MSTTENLTDRQQRRAERLDDPSFEKLRSPQARRRLSLAVLGVLALEAVVFALMGFEILPLWGFIAALAVIIFALVMALGSLKASTRGVEELPENALDERQAQIRGRVYPRAYKLVSWIVYALFAVVVLASAFGWDLPEYLMVAVGALTMQIVIIAPTLVAALSHDA